MTDRVAGIVLAAGAGTRMGWPKGLVLGPDGTPWVASAVSALTDGGCSPVFVVVGARSAEVTALVPAVAEVVVAADWAQGLAASLQAGLGAVQDQRQAQAVVIGLVDTPGVNARAVARLTGLLHSVAPEDRTGLLARAGYRGVPGHPVLIGRRHWDEVMNTSTGDAGARDYLARHDVVLVESADIAAGEDMDRLNDR